MYQAQKIHYGSHVFDAFCEIESYYPNSPLLKWTWDLYDEVGWLTDEEFCRIKPLFEEIHDHPINQQQQQGGKNEA